MGYIFSFVWIAVAVVMFLIEASTVSLVSIWFGISAIITAIISLFGIGFYSQFAVFLLISFISVLSTRKFVKRYLNIRQQSTNSDSLIGKIAVVIHDITPFDQHGRVNVSGLDWAARCDILPNVSIGESVVIKSIEGVTLIVEPVNISINFHK